MFKSSFEHSKIISIAVKRYGEFIAVDVHSRSEGVYRKFSKHTEKMIEPPKFKQYILFNDHQIYDNLLTEISSAGVLNEFNFNQFMANKATEIEALIDEFDRAIEKMCADAILSGIITLVNNENIDFKRKAASIVDLNVSSSYWTANNSNPYTDIENGCNFIRTVGKAATGSFNMIMGTQAKNALFNNAKFLAEQNLFNKKTDDILSPAMQAEGYLTHGTLTAGDYKVNIITYPQTYDIGDDNGNITQSKPYMDPKAIVLLPNMVDLGFYRPSCLVPQVIENGTIPQNGPYLIQNFVSQEEATDKVVVQMATIPVPVAIDRIFTAKVVA
jgi:hypothetical protein